MTDSEIPGPIRDPVEGTAAPEVVLKVEGVSKKFAYSLTDVLRYGTRRLVREFLGLSSRTDCLEPGEFWAVKDVSFELRRGETLGIIGRNGAGKSTLLKIINGVFLPDRGRVAIKGSVGGLIEIGAGFQPNLTGRENIYIIGSILGMSKERVDQVFDDILTFADIGDFIDSPVQSYSSGMIVRLGFAIHVFQRPDVLLADEILAVGDFEFQQKCLEKISELKKQLAMIFVSHSMLTIVRFCDRAIVLEKGSMMFDGAPEDAVTYLTSLPSSISDSRRGLPETSIARSVYTKEELRVRVDRSSEEYIALSAGRLVPRSLFGPEYCNPEKISDLSWEWIFEGTGSRTEANFLSGGRFNFSFRVTFPNARLIVGIPIFSLEGQMLTAFNTDSLGTEVPIGPDGTVAGSLIIERLSLNPGEYVPCLAIVTNGVEYIFRKVIDPIRVVRWLPTNEVHSLLFGVYAEKYQWEFASSPS